MTDTGKATKLDLFLHCHNMKQMLEQPPREFDFVRFDPIDDCNLHCLYCHNARSKAIVEAGDLRTFLEKKVVRIDNFQMGCAMEPTLDSRLADLMLLVAGSPGRPLKTFTLQTNGILLHQHDYSKMTESGLTHISISIDSADETTHKYLRGNSSLRKIISNIEAFGKACPSVHLVFITTVTSRNIGGMEALVSLGLGLGARQFILREMFYHPDSAIVDHSKMPELLLEEGEFPAMRESLAAKFGGQAEFLFADSGMLNRVTKKMATDSSMARKTK